MLRLDLSLGGGGGRRAAWLQEVARVAAPLGVLFGIGATIFGTPLFNQVRGLFVQDGLQLHEGPVSVQVFPVLLYLIL